MSDVPEPGPESRLPHLPLSSTPRRAEAQAAWAAGRSIRLSEDEGVKRDPDTMPAAWLAHADQLQAEQAEFAPLLREMGAEIRAGLGQAQPPFAADDDRDVGSGPHEDR